MNRLKMSFGLLVLLVLDMYEHAYHMDYRPAAAKYVDAFMQNVKWEEVNRRAEESLTRK